MTDLYHVRHRNHVLSNWQVHNVVPEMLHASSRYQMQKKYKNKSDFEFEEYMVS